MLEMGWAVMTEGLEGYVYSIYFYLSVYTAAILLKAAKIKL